jgi:hypothetical protein
VEEVQDLGQRSVSDPTAILVDHEPEAPYLGVIGLVPPAPVIADEE